MGSGIVEVCARAGLQVTFAEGNAELIAAGRRSIDRLELPLGNGSVEGALDPSPPGRRKPGHAHTLHSRNDRDILV